MLDWSEIISGCNRADRDSGERQEDEVGHEIITTSKNSINLSEIKPLNIKVPQIRPLADIVHFKYAHTYLLTFLLT